MTERNAQHVCSAARELYGDQVTTSIEATRVFGQPVYSVVLVHRKLNRRLSIGQISDWPYIQSAWSGALEVLNHA